MKYTRAENKYLENPLGHRAMYEDNPEDTFTPEGEIKSWEGLEQLRHRTRLGDPESIKMRLGAMRRAETLEKKRKADAKKHQEKVEKQAVELCEAMEKTVKELEQQEAVMKGIQNG